MVTIVTLKSDKPIEDFAAERNLLLEKCPEGWVLFLDSDEELSPKLKEEIEKDLDKYGCQGFRLKRKDVFLGKQLRFGETGNIKLARLGKKTAGKWSRKVHEVWEIKDVRDFPGEILHYPHKTISDFIDKINFYSEIDVRELEREKKGFVYWRVVATPIGKFLRNYILWLGFLDGYPGFVHAFMMAFQSLVVRVKQYEISR